MLADTTNRQESEPVTAEEGYARAAGTSSLKMEWHRAGAVDMVAAAGMSPHRMGLALMRLRTEWDRASKPEPRTPAQIEQLAESLSKEPSVFQFRIPLTADQVKKVRADVPLPDDKLKDTKWEARLELPNPHAGLVREDVDGEPNYRLPLPVAKRQAAQWYLHELGILLQSLKTMPEVRTGLIQWLRREDAVHIVAPVLLWWLEPKCTTCKGSGVRVVVGSGGRSSGKSCPDCRHSSVPGDRNIPHGGGGRKLVAYLNLCCRSAAKDLREGSSRVLRSQRNQDQREEISHFERDEQEARAVTMDRRDDITREAVAETARRVIGGGGGGVKP